MAPAGATAPFAYLGTSGFAAAVLDRLAEGGLSPALVVTPPDRPRGRGRRVQPPPVAARAAELGLPVLKTGDVSDPASRERLADAGVEFGVVCAFGQLIRRSLLSRLEFLNVHPSLLPRWRGAAPIERAIMAGDELTGVSIMHLVEELDAGPVALTEPVEIAPGEDFGSLEARLAARGGDLVVRALRMRAEGSLRFSPQDDSAATYADKVEPDERRLDLRRGAEELSRVVRALTPHVGAFLELDGGGRLGIVRARPAGARDGPGPGKLAAAGDELALGCGQGTLLIARVRPPGKRDMSAADYLRGHPVPAPAVP